MVLMMAMHPSLQQRLFDECFRIFPSCNSPVGVEEVQQMVYADLFIKETLRLFPVVPLASRYATGDTDLGIYFVFCGKANYFEIALQVTASFRGAPKSSWASITCNGTKLFGETMPTSSIRSGSCRIVRPVFIRIRICRSAPVSTIALVGIIIMYYVGVSFYRMIHIIQGMRYGNISLRVLAAWLVRNFRFSTDLRLDELNFRMDITLKLLNGHIVRIERRDPF